LDLLKNGASIFQVLTVNKMLGCHWNRKTTFISAAKEIDKVSDICRCCNSSVCWSKKRILCLGSLLQNI